MAKSSKLSSDSLGTKSRPSGKAMRHGNMGEALNAVDGALAEIEKIVDTSAGTLVLEEIAAPAAPGADKGVIYLDGGGTAGRSRLMVRFQSGVTQVIASEPAPA